ncbi:hypothetical protein, partial [Methylobacterium mesophilicum]|uniref:hypothetical protein n=1 Tax=Methylobacterium mesophilicum TaxID=39956 RepID=UPI001EE1C308
PAPMVLCLKARESRSPPDLHIARTPHPLDTKTERKQAAPHLGGLFAFQVLLEQSLLTTPSSSRDRPVIAAMPGFASRSRG